MPSRPGRLGPLIRIDRTWDGAPVAAGESVMLELVRVEAGLRLRVEAPFHGDPAPDGPAGSTEGLWSHEVVELFVAEAASVGEQPRYLEVELGPHGHHLLLRHEGTRRRVAVVEPTSVVAEIDGDRWRGELVIDRRDLPPEPWVGNAYAMYGAGAERRHLAAEPVPGESPDFHRPERFRPLSAESR